MIAVAVPPDTEQLDRKLAEAADAVIETLRETLKEHRHTQRRAAALKIVLERRGT